eukprot:4125437-Karenia_brevis.AAC.1
MQAISTLLSDHGVSDAQVYGERNFEYLLAHNILRLISAPAASGVDCKHSVLLAPHRASEDRWWR